MPIKTTAFDGSMEAKDDPAEAPKAATRKRRSKAELIADARLPADDEIIEVKFESTGLKGERPWLVAVELFRENKVEFVDKSLKHSVEKMDQQKAGDSDAGAGTGGDQTHNAQEQVEGLAKRWSSIQEELDDTGKSETEKIEALSQEAEQVRQQIISLGGTDPASDEGYEQRAGAHEAPEGAEVGDEVRIGSKTYRVDHERVLVAGDSLITDGEGSSELLHPLRRWQRELGAGAEGSWESVAIPAREKSRDGTISRNEKAGADQLQRATSGMLTEQVSPVEWKVGTGVLEKIGLPDYSNLVIGPNTMSRQVADDGRRTKVVIGEGENARDATVPTAAVEAYAELADTVEYVTRLQRRQLISFLEAVKPGSTRPQQ